MISEEFIQIIEDSSKINSQEDVVAFNEIILKLENKENNESQTYLFKTFHSISDVYIKSILRDSFRWSKPVGTELKTFFKYFENIRSPLFREFGNTKFLNNAFKIEYFKNFCEINLGKVGGSQIYDEGLRAISYMLEFFVNFYLCQELSFKPVLKTKNIYLYDPCFRERVREQNQSDPDILSVFFTPTFNVKSFIMHCLSTYFPNVSWRWLGGKQFAHYMTLKMILVLFEYGLWSHDELDNLITKIYSTSEILSNLESNMKKDILAKTFSEYQIEEWTVLSTKCRKKIASIFIHIMLMHLDCEIMSVLPQFQIPTSSFFGDFPLYVSKQKTDIESLFYVKRFKKKRLYTYFSYSLITYITRPMKYKNAKTPFITKSLKHLIGILVGYVCEMENNMFNISLNTLQTESMSFYLVKSNSSLCDIPKGFQNRFKDIINNIRLCSYGVLNFQNKTFLDIISGLFQEIISFFGKLPDKPEIIQTYQLAFLMQNIPQYALSMIHFIIEMGREENHIFMTVKVGVQLLIALCRENNQAINSIFSGYCYNHLCVLLKDDIINGMVLVVKLFGKTSSLYILEKNNDIFERLIQNYYDILEEFNNDVKECIESKEIKINHMNMTAIMIYNKLFSRILKNSQQKNFKF
jgi:hypothetical protein